MKRPDKLDEFMSCIFSLMAFPDTKKLFDYRMDIFKQVECVKYIGSVVGEPEVTLEDMSLYAFENYNLLKKAIG